MSTSHERFCNFFVSLRAKVATAYFPFADTEAGLDEQIKHKMRGASRDILTIIRGLKPYRGGNRALRYLHDLDIRDKHIALLQAAAAGDMPPIPFVRAGENVMKADWTKYKTEPVNPADFLHGDAAEQIEIVGKIVGAVVVISVTSMSPWGGGQAIAVLQNLAELVERIVQTFEAHCLGHK